MADVDTEQLQEQLEKVEEELEIVKAIDEIEEGGPIPYVWGKIVLAIRQPNPTEMDMIRLQENIGMHKALTLPEIADLFGYNVSYEALMERATQVAFLQVRLQKEKDKDKRAELRERIKVLDQPDTRSRAEELADKHSLRHRDRWMVENLTVHPDGSPLTIEERQKWMSKPSLFEAARPACWRVLRLATEIPN